MIQIDNKVISNQATYETELQGMAAKAIALALMESVDSVAESFEREFVRLLSENPVCTGLFGANKFAIEVVFGEEPSKLAPALDPVAVSVSAPSREQQTVRVVLPASLNSMFKALVANSLEGEELSLTPGGEDAIRVVPACSPSTIC